MSQMEAILVEWERMYALYDIGPSCTLFRHVDRLVATRNEPGSRLGQRPKEIFALSTPIGL